MGRAEEQVWGERQGLCGVSNHDCSSVRDRLRSVSHAVGFTYLPLQTMAPRALACSELLEWMSYPGPDSLLRGSHWFLAQPVTP